MKHPIVIPHLGATGGDVKIVEWLVAEGQSVKAGHALFVVETDKSTSEVEAFRDGVIDSIVSAAGSECAPGDVVGHLADEPDASRRRAAAHGPAGRRAPRASPWGGSD